MRASGVTEKSASHFIDASRVAARPTSDNVRFFCQHGWLIVSAPPAHRELVDDWTQQCVLPHFASGGEYCATQYPLSGPVSTSVCELIQERLDELAGFPRRGRWSFANDLPDHIAHDWNWRSPQLLATLDVLFGRDAAAAADDAERGDTDGVDWGVARERYEAARASGFRDGRDLRVAPPLRARGRRWYCEPVSAGSSNRLPLGARDAATHGPASWTPQILGWHIDGPPRGLGSGAFALTMLAFHSRVAHGGGATTVQDGSHASVARLLRCDDSRAAVVGGGQSGAEVEEEDARLPPPLPPTSPSCGGYVSKPWWDCCFAELPLLCTVICLQCRCKWGREVESSSSYAARCRSSPCCVLWSLLLACCCLTRGAGRPHEWSWRKGARGAISELGADVMPLEPGDVVLMHGLLRHSASPNHRSVLRVASQNHVHHWRAPPPQRTANCEGADGGGGNCSCDRAAANVRAALRIRCGELDIAPRLELRRIEEAYHMCGAAEAWGAVEAGALAPLEALVGAELAQRRGRRRGKSSTLPG